MPPPNNTPIYIFFESFCTQELEREIKERATIFKKSLDDALVHWCQTLLDVTKATDLTNSYLNLIVSKHLMTDVIAPKARFEPYMKTVRGEGRTFPVLVFDTNYAINKADGKSIPLSGEVIFNIGIVFQLHFSVFYSGYSRAQLAA